MQLDNLPVGKRGIEIKLSNRVEVPYSVKGFANDVKDDKAPATLFRPKYDRKKLPPEESPVPFVVLQKIEIVPDFVALWPPAEWNSDVNSAEELLHVWMERAWRRPVKKTEGERFLALFEKLQREGMTYDESLRAAFQSVLLSGGFRYLRPDDVASRLSFMLWGAPPDGELRQLAQEGKLRDAKVLDSQIDRLLTDPRSDAFFEPFVTQWLELGQPITIVMDRIGQQDFRFARHLKESMRGETIRYIAELFRENRPAREIVASDWTFMNQALARHYGYEGVEGARLRKVKLKDDDPRGGGVLGHAGIQSMLCWMGDNWVIYRGVWALRHFMDSPPPPPPLDIPELVPSDKENQGKDFRQLLVQHQADRRCAVCHKSIDPLGFAFQNFDISGRWREEEFERYQRNELDGKIEWHGAGKSRPVDAAGKLPRGEEFTSFAGFKMLLVKEYSADLVRGLMKNLVVYAAGKKPGVGDMKAIREIIRANQSRDYPLRELLKDLIRSRMMEPASTSFHDREGSKLHPNALGPR